MSLLVARRSAIGGQASVALSYDATILAESSLQGFWKLNDPTGITAVDASPGGHNGTYTGSFALAQTSILPTDAEKCVNFTGGSMSVPDTATLRLGAGDYTVECWIKPSSLASYSTVIDDAARGYTLLINAANVATDFFVGVGGSSQGSFTMSTSIVVSSTYHLAYVHGPGNAQAMYLNGTSVCSSSLFGGATNSSTGFSLLANPSGSGGLLQSRVQKLAIYNSALSSGRISAHFAAA